MMDWTASAELTGLLASTEKSFPLLDYLPNRASSAHQDRQDPREPWAPRVHLGHVDRLELRVKTGKKENPA